MLRPDLQEIEGTLHCVMAVQEAVPVEDNAHLARIFGPEILGRLPVTGNVRVRRTALLLIGALSSIDSATPAKLHLRRILCFVVHYSVTKVSPYNIPADGLCFLHSCGASRVYTLLTGCKRPPRPL